MLGLRLHYLSQLFEVYMRLQLFKGGAIDSHLQYIPEMECGGQKFQISKHEHEEICVNLNALVNSADNSTSFWTLLQILRSRVNDALTGQSQDSGILAGPC